MLAPFPDRGYTRYRQPNGASDISAYTSIAYPATVCDTIKMMIHYHWLCYVPRKYQVWLDLYEDNGEFALKHASSEKGTKGTGCDATIDVTGNRRTGMQQETRIKVSIEDSMNIDVLYPLEYLSSLISKFHLCTVSHHKTPQTDQSANPDLISKIFPSPVCLTAQYIVRHTRAIPKTQTSCRIITVETRVQGLIRILQIHARIALLYETIDPKAKQLMNETIPRPLHTIPKIPPSFFVGFQGCRCPRQRVLV